MKRILLFFLLLAFVLATLLRLRYGGGDSYPDLSTPPMLSNAGLETVLSYSEPIGNVAVSPEGRLFFTVHPESRPRGNRLLEYVEGASVPYPNIESQLELFDTVLGLTVDRQNRLWTIDHGKHGLRKPRIIAFDLATNRLLVNYALPADVAPAGSCLQDLRVSYDGTTVVIADASFLRQAPALVVYDVMSGTARRLLERHDAVSTENFRIDANGEELSWLGGIMNLKGGVDGIALGPEWLYLGALTGSDIHRIALENLENPDLSAAEIAARVEYYAPKPLSGGFDIDQAGNLYLTDVEHNSVYVVGHDRKPRTLIRSESIRWPDGLAFGPDGWLYISDSALPELVLRPRKHIEGQRPYRIFRFRPGITDTSGR
jgi:sugar lactone lactonase YvrE